MITNVSVMLNILVELIKGWKLGLISMYYLRTIKGGRKIGNTSGSVIAEHLINIIYTIFDILVVSSIPEPGSVYSV